MPTEPTKPIVTATAAPTKPSAPATPAFTFSKELLEKRLEQIRKFQYTFSGKPGYNPYLWLSRNVGPLERRLLGVSTSDGKIKPEESKELHDLIMRLPIDCAPKTPEAPAS